MDQFSPTIDDSSDWPEGQPMNTDDLSTEADPGTVPPTADSGKANQLFRQPWFGADNSPLKTDNIRPLAPRNPDERRQPIACLLASSSNQWIEHGGKMSATLRYMDPPTFYTIQGTVFRAGNLYDVRYSRQPSPRTLSPMSLHDSLGYTRPDGLWVPYSSSPPPYDCPPSPEDARVYLSPGLQTCTDELDYDSFDVISEWSEDSITECCSSDGSYDPLDRPEEAIGGECCIADECSACSWTTDSQQGSSCYDDEEWAECHPLPYNDEMLNGQIPNIGLESEDSALAFPKSRDASDNQGLMDQALLASDSNLEGTLGCFHKAVGAPRQKEHTQINEKSGDFCYDSGVAESPFDSQIPPSAGFGELSSKVKYLEDCYNSAISSKVPVEGSALHREAHSLQNHVLPFDEGKYFLQNNCVLNGADGNALPNQALPSNAAENGLPNPTLPINTRGHELPTHEFSIDAGTHGLNNYAFPIRYRSSGLQHTALLTHSGDDSSLNQNLSTNTGVSELQNPPGNAEGYGLPNPSFPMQAGAHELQNPASNVGEYGIPNSAFYIPAGAHGLQNPVSNAEAYALPNHNFSIPAVVHGFQNSAISAGEYRLPNHNFFVPAAVHGLQNLAHNAGEYGLPNYAFPIPAGAYGLQNPFSNTGVYGLPNYVFSTPEGAHRLQNPASNVEAYGLQNPAFSNPAGAQGFYNPAVTIPANANGLRYLTRRCKEGTGLEYSDLPIHSGSNGLHFTTLSSNARANGSHYPTLPTYTASHSSDNHVLMTIPSIGRLQNPALVKNRGTHELQHRVLPINAESYGFQGHEPPISAEATGLHNHELSRHAGTRGFQNPALPTNAAADTLHIPALPTNSEARELHNHLLHVNSGVHELHNQAVPIHATAHGLEHPALNINAAAHTLPNNSFLSNEDALGLHYHALPRNSGAHVLHDRSVPIHAGADSVLNHALPANEVPGNFLTSSGVQNQILHTSAGTNPGLTAVRVHNQVLHNNEWSNNDLSTKRAQNQVLVTNEGLNYDLPIYRIQNGPNPVVQTNIEPYSRSFNNRCTNELPINAFLTNGTQISTLPNNGIANGLLSPVLLNDEEVYKVSNTALPSNQTPNPAWPTNAGADKAPDSELPTDVEAREKLRKIKILLASELLECDARANSLQKPRSSRETLPSLATSRNNVSPITGPSGNTTMSKEAIDDRLLKLRFPKTVEELETINAISRGWSAEHPARSLSWDHLVEQQVALTSSDSALPDAHGNKTPPKDKVDFGVEECIAGKKGPLSYKMYVLESIEAIPRGERKAQFQNTRLGLISATSNPDGSDCKGNSSPEKRENANIAKCSRSQNKNDSRVYDGYDPRGNKPHHTSKVTGSRSFDDAAEDQKSEKVKRENTAPRFRKKCTSISKADHLDDTALYRASLESDSRIATKGSDCMDRPKRARNERKENLTKRRLIKGRCPTPQSQMEKTLSQISLTTEQPINTLCTKNEFLPKKNVQNSSKNNDRSLHGSLKPKCSLYLDPTARVEQQESDECQEMGSTMEIEAGKGRIGEGARSMSANERNSGNESYDGNNSIRGSAAGVISKPYRLFAPDPPAGVRNGLFGVIKDRSSEYQSGHASTDIPESDAVVRPEKADEPTPKRYLDDQLNPRLKSQTPASSEFASDDIKTPLKMASLDLSKQKIKITFRRSNLPVVTASTSKERGGPFETKTDNELQDDQKVNICPKKISPNTGLFKTPFERKAEDDKILNYEDSMSAVRNILPQATPFDFDGNPMYNKYGNNQNNAPPNNRVSRCLYGTKVVDAKLLKDQNGDNKTTTNIGMPKTPLEVKIAKAKPKNGQKRHSKTLPKKEKLRTPSETTMADAEPLNENFSLSKDSKSQPTSNICNSQGGTTEYTKSSNVLNKKSSPSKPQPNTGISSEIFEKMTNSILSSEQQSHATTSPTNGKSYSETPIDMNSKSSHSKTMRNRQDTPRTSFEAKEDFEFLNDQDCSSDENDNLAEELNFMLTKFIEFGDRRTIAPLLFLLRVFKQKYGINFLHRVVWEQIELAAMDLLKNATRKEADKLLDMIVISSERG